MRQEAGRRELRHTLAAARRRRRGFLAADRRYTLPVSMEGFAATREAIVQRGRSQRRNVSQAGQAGATALQMGIQPCPTVAKLREALVFLLLVEL